MVRYVAVIVAAVAGMVAVGVIAKLSLLGGWSAPFYILTTLALLAVAAVALYRGTRHDIQHDQSDADNDYEPQQPARQQG
jgi:membrane protein implicated in regulation of membrane protease activity